MLWLDIISGTVISVLCGMGIGGGGLYVIYLTLLRNISQINAQGINLAFFICASFFALFVHFKKTELNLKIIMPIAYSGAIFSLFGSLLAHELPNSVIRRFFGTLLIIGALIGLFQNKGNKNKASS
ncbi:MAG: sulfite exporter TauE/SafE family protein [Clostridia bacterium]|nr:sulfite exporter TauE/SafE family protein [Clostridia bacterium]